MGNSGYFVYSYSNLFNNEIYKLNVDLIMSALTLCAKFIKYDPLIITLLNRAKNRAILPSFLAVT